MYDSGLILSLYTKHVEKTVNKLISDEGNC